MRLVSFVRFVVRAAALRIGPNRRTCALHRILAAPLKCAGIGIPFAIKDARVYVWNEPRLPARAVRAKATAWPLARLAALVMAGNALGI